ncbi:MAG: ABC transporter ATP-binding protein, partial [Patescibacteria group bacterium]
MSKTNVSKAIDNDIDNEYTPKIGFLRTCIRALQFAFRTAPWFSTTIIITGFIAGAVPIILSKIMQHLIDAAFSLSTGAVAYSSFAALIVGWAIFKFADDVSEDFEGYVRSNWRYKLQNATEMLFLGKSVEIDIARHEDPKFKNFKQRAFIRGYHVITELNGFILGSSRDIIRLVIGAAIAINFSWTISLLLILTQIPSFVTSIVFGRRIWGIWDRTSHENRRMQHYKEHLSGTSGIIQSKLFQNSARLLSMIKEILVRTQEKFSSTELKRLWWEAIATAIRSIGYVIAIIAIIKSVQSGTVSVGEMTFLLASIFTFSGSIGSLLSSIGIINEWTLYVRDALTYLDLKPLMPKPTHPIKLHLSETPTIKLENVSFTYHGSEKPTLQINSLVIQPGEKIAVVGLNGAGKTTLMRLLTHIENPTAGSMSVNGVDLKNVESREWHQHLAVLPQNYSTYDFSVVESIAFSDSSREIDRVNVEKALRDADALGFVNRWEKGIDTQLGREFGGNEPSMGQRQKLAVARVLYRNAKVLILDEPTASVDADSRLTISNSLASQPSNKTIICISHDFAAVRRFDRILVLNNGILVEDGSHTEL